ncbi:glycine cleavage system protein R [Sneathiella sp.]|uniref:glycine cleavage system protein R n=1 Tax=Sneathiella sp. TaxID=1964365 RepID=UPI002FE3E06F
MSTYKALLSVFSKDRIGLISLLSGHLFDKGVNLGDTSFAILGKGCAFTSIIEIPSEISESELAGELASLEGLEQADVDLRRFVLDDVETPPSRITHHIRCEGEDQPGLLARLTEVFIDFEANIVRLKSDQVKENDQTWFITLFSVYIPPERAENCLAALGNTAGLLGQTLTFEAEG